MNINEYQQYVKTGASPKYCDLNFALLALVGEVGEVCDTMKKYNIYTNATTPTHNEKEKFVDELGDVLWQWMACVNAIHASVDEIIEYNVQKLNKRHGGAQLDTTGGKR